MGKNEDFLDPINLLTANMCGSYQRLSDDVGLQSGK